MKVCLYRKSRGRYPVKDFLEELPVKHRKKILKTFEKLNKYGLRQFLKTGDVKKIKRKNINSLYELIVDYDGVFYRIFFSVTKKHYLMTHIFKKKSNKTPQNEINQAIRIHKNLNL